MQTWRRYLTTSASTLTYKRSNPVRLRCSQILRASETSRDLSKLPEDREIQVKGFVRSVRKQKHFAFAEISDGSTIQSLQAVLSPDQASRLATGAAVEISGLWKPCPPGKEQSHELHATVVKVVGEADPETYPIQKKYHSPDFLRQIPHLRLRTPFNSLLSRFRSECIFQLGNVFHSHPDKFLQVQPPLITSSDCEGAGGTFAVTPRDCVTKASDTNGFFRGPRYLTVSSQLHLEAYAAELGNVWTLSPTFRAEKSDTPRHLSEFYMLEVEVSFVQDLGSLLDLVESLIRDLTKRVYNTSVCEEILTAKKTGESGQEGTDAALRGRWLALIEGDSWPRITYTRAIELLKDAAASKAASFKFDPSWSAGLQLEHEKFIVDMVGEGAPVFVTDYPKGVKPFYMAPSPAAEETTRSSSGFARHPMEPGGETVACFDLLMPEISEVVGGSIREHRLPYLIQNMRDRGLIKIGCTSQPSPSASDAVGMALHTSYPYLQPREDLGPLRWYADLRRWGSAPHGGFGLGFDRFLGYLAGVSSIRDVVPFPRYFGKADC